MDKTVKSSREWRGKQSGPRELGLALGEHWRGVKIVLSIVVQVPVH
jgi:hypothetical protein